MKRRPKGMGCVAFLGTGRRKPYVATLKKKCIGTFKSEADRGCIESMCLIS